MDADALRRCGLRDQPESVVAASDSIVYRAGDNHAWDTVLLPLAQARRCCFAFVKGSSLLRPFLGLD